MDKNLAGWKEQVHNHRQHKRGVSSTVWEEAHMEVFEQLQLVVYVQNRVPAVDHVERTFWERPLGGISHLELDLMQCTLQWANMSNRGLNVSEMSEVVVRLTDDSFSLMALSKAMFTMFSDRSKPSTSTPKLYDTPKAFGHQGSFNSSHDLYPCWRPGLFPLTFAM